MRTLVICFAVACLSLSAAGQQYLVRYDVVAEELKYFRIKKNDTIPVKIIFLNGSNRVNLQVLNIGSNYTQQVIMHEKAELAEPVLIPGIGGQSGQGIESLFKLGENISVEDMLKNIGGDNKSNAAELRAAMQAFTMHYNRFNERYEQWVEAVKQSAHYLHLWKELALLRYGLQYDAQTVKQTAIMKTRPVMPALVTDPNSLSIGTGNAEPDMIFRHVRASFKGVHDSYEKINELDITSREMDSLVSQLDLRVSQAEQFIRSNPVATSELITRITALYKAIMFDRYSQLSNLPVNRRTLVAELQLIPNIDSVTSNAIQLTASDTIVRWVPIVKKEPMRFRNTFGFAFVSLPETRWRYYVRPDSTVARTSGDLFQPLLATYLHFYSMKDKGFRWGGSFGAGIPLSGEDKQLNLMLGLSTFLGRNDPVCLTLGIAGARVKKLMEHNLGDVITDGSELKYDQAYRIGYFLSLSFNPSALNAKD